MWPTQTKFGIKACLLLYNKYKRISFGKQLLFLFLFYIFSMCILPCQFGTQLSMLKFFQLKKNKLQNWSWLTLIVS